MFCSSCIGFILHLEHDGNKLCALFATFTINKVSFTAGLCIVVLLKICVRKCSHSDGIELCETVLFQAFAYHFGRLTCLKILIVLNQFLLLFELVFILFLQRLLLQTVFSFLTFDFPPEISNLCDFLRKFRIFLLDSFCNSKFLFCLAGI